jgi:hypothetical protein
MGWLASGIEAMAAVVDRPDRNIDIVVLAAQACRPELGSGVADIKDYKVLVAQDRKPGAVRYSQEVVFVHPYVISVLSKGN